MKLISVLLIKGGSLFQDKHFAFRAINGFSKVNNARLLIQ